MQIIHSKNYSIIKILESLVKLLMINNRGKISSLTVYPHFPSPALSGAGSMGLISACIFEAPLLRYYKITNKFINTANGKLVEIIGYDLK